MGSGLRSGKCCGSTIAVACCSEQTDEYRWQATRYINGVVNGMETGSMKALCRVELMV